MTSPLTSASAATAVASATTSSTTSATQPLGQDAFLKLLMAQLSNQDPLNPTSGTEFVTQLAQFSMVEQSQAQSTTLSTISTQLTGLSNSDATQLVGQNVTLSGSTLSWNGNTATSSSVTLGAAAQQVEVQITNSSGNVVRTIQLGSEPSGPLSVSWNGNTDAGQPAPSGNYTMNVTAADASGGPVAVTQSVTGIVTSVSFSQGYPQVTLANGTVAPVSELVSVGNASTQP
jgi:flagellar basal-body rod modification protein FlgD